MELGVRCIAEGIAFQMNAAVLDDQQAADAIPDDEFIDAELAAIAAVAEVERLAGGRQRMNMGAAAEDAHRPVPVDAAVELRLPLRRGTHHVVKFQRLLARRRARTLIHETRQRFCV
jgi:hypothetical protein